MFFRDHPEENVSHLNMLITDPDRKAGGFTVWVAFPKLKPVMEKKEEGGRRRRGKKEEEEGGRRRVGRRRKRRKKKKKQQQQQCFSLAQAGLELLSEPLACL